MVVEYNYFPMGINMKEIIAMASQKGMEYINGTMEPFIKESLKMEYDMDMECGLMGRRAIKEYILMIREMGKEFINGEKRAIIKGSLWKT